MIAVAALALLAAALVHPGLETGVLHLAPALTIVALLFLGRYVGERTIARIAGHGEPRAPRMSRVAPQLRPLARTLARGGDLLGTALAVRPPPAAPVRR
jgi:hypothetical protein